MGLSQSSASTGSVFAVMRWVFTRRLLDFFCISRPMTRLSSSRPASNGRAVVKFSVPLRAESPKPRSVSPLTSLNGRRFFDFARATKGPRYAQNDVEWGSLKSTKTTPFNVILSGVCAAKNLTPTTFAALQAQARTVRSELAQRPDAGYPIPKLN